jgi:8-oxo-dGTP pyrophosphatase MutT (NUDIX family)
VTIVTEPIADPIAEAERLAAGGAEQEVPMRMIGGVAVAIRCESARKPPLDREYHDIDVLAPARKGRAIRELMEELGYEQDQAFNALHGGHRLYFWDPLNERQVDVFLDRMEMCHAFDFSKRIDVDPPTLSLADLLLLKLQIVEANHKDYLDMLALLTDHDLTDDDTGINVRYISSLAADDWGLWRTTTNSAERVDHIARELDGFVHTARIHEQIRTLLTALEEEPKSRRWKMRAKIGERRRWYEVPEEEH